MDIRLDGKKALITGGSRGMGRGIALKFSESGAEVAIVARRPDVLEETKREMEAATGGKVFAYSCDMGDAEAIKAMWAAALDDLGQIDILVNNAGTSTRGPFEEISDEMWEEDLGLKLFGAIRTCRLAFPSMKQRRWGRIINVVTVGGKAPPAGSAPTSVSRAAGMAMTKVLAGEGAPHNVLVNALCTGRIVTDQIAGRYEREKPDISFEEFVAEYGRDIPLGRMGTAEEYANMACFLASDAASFITGTAVNIDGGFCPVV